MPNNRFFHDAKYLKTEQYKDATNLSARIRIHQQFSTNKGSFWGWVFDGIQGNLDSGPKRVLELGCGRADFWKENLERIPQNWAITLSDFSPGMLDEARATLKDVIDRFDFKVIDAQDIPFEAATFNVVIANAMLYHVPDRPKGIAEIRRVLKPDGTLFAVTFGKKHMRRLYEIVGEVSTTYLETGLADENPFSLESGGEQLARSFANIEVIRYQDSLKVTEVQPLMDYVRSSRAANQIDEDQWNVLQDHFEAIMQKDGHVFIPKDSGMFIASGQV